MDYLFAKRKGFNLILVRNVDDEDRARGVVAEHLADTDSPHDVSDYIALVRGAPLSAPDQPYTLLEESA